MTRFQNKYRIESARHPHWDYSANGWYFITICTRDRHPFFGEIQNDTMQLSEIGEVVAEEWQKTAIVRPYVVLDEWIVMPNHFHAIVGIQHSDCLGSTHLPDDVETFRRNVSTGVSRLQPKSLGSIVGQFKSGCTKRIWAMGFQEFAWQPRFHDRIIRDRTSFNHIRHYIQTNPKRWKTDKFYR
jgi:putative transposase